MSLIMLLTVVPSLTIKRFTFQERVNIKSEILDETELTTVSTIHSPNIMFELNTWPIPITRIQYQNVIPTEPMEES
jgi:hypothetical protein